ncbi:cobyric acid synthase CobQ [Hyphomicrobium methylovorum]|uniref:cobyric acid synthase n=1 Tax=Hyphomicrobium methylovorum TaxID=84 RepID=UPI0015E6D950|nr:cobyric acid synthase [Hyphomicrobium methylovorum]MBA2126742.1 cobyric acid synthase CobQ [Hyphomicrobium methylovorum]
MPARALMFVGTGSDVGKSLIVAGLCRLCANRGLRVRPFKPQNMSNNAAVTADGGEIGRAQALQARAARVPLSVHMNPVLLKPQSETGAQVIVQGRMIETSGARAFQSKKRSLMPAVLESFEHLKADADIVLVEGAGSASEINLRANDIANLGFARTADVPVILIGDIDRGGVIASLVGTKHVLDAADAQMIQGFIVNKMRGDPTLFADGMTAITYLTGWPALGLVPFFNEARRLPPEDALALDERRAPTGKPVIAVLAYPRISNFDDFDPLRLDTSVDLQILRSGEPIPGDARLVILPGSKSTIADLNSLRDFGWDVDLAAHIRRGGHVLGVCGGYQMLGTAIHDPDGIEGNPATVAGLGYIDIETRMSGDKKLIEISGQLSAQPVPFDGYEMHVGESTGPGLERPLLEITGGRPDGAIDASGRISGCYVHGLFSNDRMRAHWLQRIGIEADSSAAFNYEHDVDATLDAFAEHLAQHIDIEQLLSLAK